MQLSFKPIVAGAMLLAGITRATCAQTLPAASYQPPASQAAAPPSDKAPSGHAVILPEVTVVAPQPYAPGNGQRAGSGNNDHPYHFQPWPGYYNDPALHPYTSGLGPRPSSGNRIPASHFRVWRGYDSDPTLHPYSSGLGPCPEGGLGSGCAPHHHYLIKPSRYERSPFTD